MARNESTSKGIGRIASKGLRTGKLSPSETRRVSASTLTQVPDKGKGKKGK